MSGGITPVGVSPVARGRMHMSGRTRAMGLLGCCALAGAAAAWIMWPRHQGEPEVTPVAGQGWSMGRSLPERETAISPPSTIVVAPPPQSPKPAAITPAVPAPPQMQAMGFWEDSGALQQAAQQLASRTAPGSSPGRADPDVATPGPASSEYAQRMQSTHFADTAPTPPHFHVQYTIKKGTVFPCTPASPISSSLPGPVQCTVGRDVWSMDGTTILLPRGTQVNGSIERGITTGEDRLYLVWTDALTPRPDLLAIPLDSPAADELGQVGAPGDVNEHLWKKLKTALLLSAVDIAGSAVTAAAQSGQGNTNINLGAVGGTANSLGQMAFGHDLNIPPTLYRGPGQPLTVYVSHYIDLFRFYQNRTVR
jgi:type IV secretion system protein VirB10